MLRFLLNQLPTKTLQNIINVCAHQLFKRKYWRKVTSSYPELSIPLEFVIIVSSSERWEWKVKDNFDNEIFHGISPTEQMAILDSHMSIELLENDNAATIPRPTKTSNYSNS